MCLPVWASSSQWFVFSDPQIAGWSLDDDSAEGHDVLSTQDTWPAQTCQLGHHLHGYIRIISTYLISSIHHQPACASAQHQHSGHQLCNLWAMRQSNMWYRIDEPAIGWCIKLALFKMAKYGFSPTFRNLHISLLASSHTEIHSPSTLGENSISMSQFL